MFRRGVVNEVKKAAFADVRKAPFFHGVFRVVQATKRISTTLRAAPGEEAAVLKPEHIRVTKVGGHAVVSFNNLERVVDPGAELKQLERELQALASQGSWVSVILDFEGKAFIPWAAFEFRLVRLHKKLDGKLKMCCLPPNVMDHFEMNHLVDVFHIYSTREEALASVM